MSNPLPDYTRRFVEDLLKRLNTIETPYDAETSARMIANKPEDRDWRNRYDGVVIVRHGDVMLRVSERQPPYEVRIIETLSGPRHHAWIPDFYSSYELQLIAISSVRGAAPAILGTIDEREQTLRVNDACSSLALARLMTDINAWGSDQVMSRISLRPKEVR